MEGPAAAQLTGPGPQAVPRRRTGTGAVVGAIATRPRLWPAALRQARALVPAGWWRRRPFLPVPDRDWLAFRMTTAYGDPGAAVDVEDLLTWLAWTDTTKTCAEGSRPRSTRFGGSAGVGRRAHGSPRLSAPLPPPAPPVGGPSRP